MNLVSVIIPNFNSEIFISATLKCLQEQAFSDWEALIVDDGSTDRSAAIIDAFAQQDTRIRLIKLPPGNGAAKARNAAIRESRGRYFAFLDADDLWRPEKLAVQLAAMQAVDAAMSCTAVDVVDADGAIVGERRVPTSIDYSTLLRRTPIVTSTVVIDTHKTGKVQMPDIVRRQDLGLWLKVIRENGPVLGIDQVLGSYRVHAGSLSRNKLTSALYTWRVIRQVEGLGFFTSAYYFLNYALKGTFSRVKGLN